MLKRGIPLFFMLFLLVYCTQLAENDEAGTNTYAGNDGCVYCHTNEARLKVLAPPEDDGGGAGGG